MNIASPIPTDAKAVAEWLVSNHQGKVISLDDDELVQDIAGVLREFRSGPVKVRLSRQQKAVVGYLQAQERAGEPVPSYQDIADALGISSKSVVSRLLHGLEGLGVVTLHPGKSRSIAVAVGV